MKIRTFGAVLAATMAVGASAQTMELGGGNLTIQEGTTMELSGPLEFLILSNATVVNDGLIDLGTAAVVSEPVGSPISGSGVEVAVLDASGPFSAVEPGGLGLTLTTSTTSGPITVTRGHTSLSFPEGDPSIRRWFVVDAPEANSGTMDLVLNYDAIELGLLEASSLSLFRAPALDGPWTALPSTNDAVSHTVSTSWSAPWTVVTAFDANAPTVSTTLFANDDLHVWPTLTNGLVYVETQDGSALGGMELLDATGRPVLTLIDRRNAGLASLDLSDLASGAYFLRIGQRSTIKLRKE